MSRKPGVFNRLLEMIGLVEDDPDEGDGMGNHDRSRPSGGTQTYNPGTRRAPQVGGRSPSSQRPSSSGYSSGASRRPPYAANGDFDRDYDAEDRRSASARPRERDRDDDRPSNVVNLRQESRQDPRQKMVLCNLRSLEECRDIITDLLENRTVLLNLEDMDDRLVQRAIDMLSGAAFALNATLRKASDRTYIIAPTNVDVASMNDTQRRY